MFYGSNLHGLWNGQWLKSTWPLDWTAADQAVGEVMAHQTYNRYGL